MLIVNQCLPEEKMEPMVICLGEEIPSAQPDQRFVLEEYYCEHPECDCNELVVSVVEVGEDNLPIGKPPLARIQYSWATLETIARPKLIEDEEQSPMANEFLASYAKLCATPEYNERVAKHYEIVKEYGEWEESQPVISYRNISRNEPCPCGSGKKHKKCCMV